MVGEVVDERYELEERIGVGGMSNVFRAHDTLLERHVALKILHEQYTEDEEYVERFRREARAAAQLSHPNIVTVIDRGESGGRQYIVFEYVEGENLKQLVARSGPLPVRQALELGIQIGRALAFAHANGLVHRDVKPQNVLLGNGEAKVTDFGIARSLDVAHGLTQTGTVMGTSDYIAPEQASGHGSTEQSDVYSLGVVLYELLTGKPPYSGDNFVAVAMRHVNEPVPSLIERRPEVPARLETAVRTAMAKDPADRFPTMAEFEGELEACLRELGAPDGDRTMIKREPVASPRARRQRRSLPLALVAVLLVAGAIAAALYFGLRHTGGGGGTPTVASVAHAVSLSSVASYDPVPGDGTEHDERLQYATDRDPTTYWETELYAGNTFGGLKSGVGLVLAAPQATKLATLTIKSNTPGFHAVIKAGSSTEGPFADVSSNRTVNKSTTFQLHVPEPRRYYLVWITQLVAVLDRVEINEVTATGP